MSKQRWPEVVKQPNPLCSGDKVSILSQKKAPELDQVNHAMLAILNPKQIEVEIWREDELAVHRGLSSELDEMWSYVAKKTNPRWLWHAIDHRTGKVLAYVLGRR